MNNIAKAFDHGKAFVAFITCGDPDLDTTAACVRAAVQAFEYLSRTEGIIPAIESAHAVAHALKLVPTMGKDQIAVINISGRGDKDCAAIARYRGEDLHD